MAGGFHEILFPPEISYGAMGGPGFHTTIMTLASGFERRNIDWSAVRAQYTVGQNVKTLAQLNILRKFFYARVGRAYGFRFIDIKDYQMPFYNVTPGDVDVLPLLFTTDGVTATFQIRKPYGDAGATFFRPLTKLVTGSVALLLNASPFSDWTVNVNTGIVTLGGTTTATTGGLITGSCQFHVPVRFDSDNMPVSMDELENNNWSGINLMEVRV